MTPHTLSKSGTEHAHQVAVFAYRAVAYLHGFEVANAWCDTGMLPKPTEEGLKSPKVPALEWLHAIANGGSRGDNAQSRAIRGGALKAEGVKPGVSDLFLPWPVWDTMDLNGNPFRFVRYAGLYIEMKKPAQKPKTPKGKGGASDEQIKFGEYVKRVGYGFAICYSWEEAVLILRSYIEFDGV